MLSLTFQHGEEEDKHLFLQTEQFSEQLHLAGVLVEFTLKDGKHVKETGHSVPEPAARESLLVQHTRSLQGEREEKMRTGEERWSQEETTTSKSY